tara:strand:+ start:4321 stop:5067 length:747 start_codon:yes stop_codon:yes gene_type:complete
VDRKTYTGTTVVAKDDAPEGSVAVQFSVFGEVDSDVDVTRKGAFGEQSAQLTPYGHSMGQLPIGLGTVTEDEKSGIFTGRFFMEMASARETFHSVKGMGDQQEWSYEFDIVRFSEGDHEGQHVRFLEELKVYGISPVYRGAGSDTQTLAIKGDRVSFGDHGDSLGVAIDEYLKRAEARVAMRSKEGRSLGADDRDQVEELVIQLRSLGARLEDALKSGATDNTAATAAFHEYQKTMTRLNGVSIPAEG